MIKTFELLRLGIYRTIQCNERCIQSNTAMNTTVPGKFIAYYRVSTARQGRSGLGIEAQKQAVASHLNGRTPIAEFTEVESGRRSDHPQLAAALAACRLHKAVLVLRSLCLAAGGNLRARRHHWP
jgi:hypothetical protein